MGISNTIPPSRLIQPGVVANTAARPSSPFEGQAIYQADTDEVLYYNGTSWSRPWNMPWGFVALTTNATSGTATTTETAVMTTSSFTAVANRYYRLSYYEPITCKPTVDQASTSLRIRLTNVSGTELQYGQNQSAGTGNSAISLNLSIVRTLTAGSTVIVATAYASTGTASLFRSATAPAVLFVEDVGPV